MFIQWSDEKYALGLPEIDRQHQELFLITNQLHQWNQSGGTPAEKDALFKRLYAYTRYHFSSEEGMFRHFGYPSEGHHRDIHKGFTLEVKERIEWYRKNPLKPLDELLDYLVDWIVGHICGEDPLYRDYYRLHDIDVSLFFTEDKAGTGALKSNAQALWKEKNLAMNIESIDREHKELVLILQQFNDLQKAREERKTQFLPVYIHKLTAYSEYHFSHEEELMAKYAYPDLQNHRLLHEEFIQKAQDFEREFDLHKETLLDEIIIFLRDWTIKHILDEDAKYKELLQSKMHRD